MTRKKTEVDWGAHLDNVFSGIPSALTNSPHPVPRTVPAHVPQHNEHAQRVDQQLSPATIRQSDSQTVKQSETQTVQPLDSQTVKQSETQTVKYSDTRTVRQSDKQTVEPSNSMTVKQQSKTRSVETTHREIPQTIPQTVPQTVNYRIPLDVLTLSYNQAAVLEYLLTKIECMTCYQEIERATNVKMPSARDAISRLVQKGFMAKPVTVRNYVFQGFSYILNKTLCDHFITAGGLERKEHQTVPQTAHQTVPQSDSHRVGGTNRQRLHSSSSFLDLKTTTTTNEVSDGQTVRPLKDTDVGPTESPPESFVLAGPEAIYWQDLGLQERQVKKWCSEYEVTPEEIRQQLAWARWDLVNNNKEQEIQNPLNWFYAILRKTAGCYPPPKGYQTPAEIRAARQKTQREADQRAVQELASEETEIRFQSLLSKPDSADYQLLLQNLPEVARDMKGRALESFLREKFIADEKRG